MIRYSIIIPHKNSIETLKRCLHSIPSRDDIQVIVIDDNSDLSTTDFKFTVNPNVELVFTKEGKGAGYARNQGLIRARGKWILFADADDFFEKNFDKILDENFNSKAEIVYYKTKSVISETLQAAPNRVNYQKMRNINKLRYSHVPWGKMIRSEFISTHNIRFDETFVANDAYFSVYSGINANHIEFVDKVVYVSTINKNSLFHKKSIEKELIRLSVVKKINELLKHHHLSKQRICVLYFICNLKCFSKEEYKKELSLYLKNESIISILIDLYKYFRIVSTKQKDRQHIQQSKISRKP